MARGGGSLPGQRKGMYVLSPSLRYVCVSLSRCVYVCACRARPGTVSRPLRGVSAGANVVLTDASCLRALTCSLEGCGLGAASWLLSVFFYFFVSKFRPCGLAYSGVQGTRALAQGFMGISRCGAAGVVPDQGRRAWKSRLPSTCSRASLEIEYERSQ